MDLKKFVKEKVQWFGQFSLLFDFGKKIFVDPYNLPDNFDIKADFIFITHDHFDHLSVEDIKKTIKSGTQIFIPASSVEKIKDFEFENIQETRPGMNFDLENFSVETVPMYNLVKTKFHPRDKEWTGLVFEYEGMKFYVTSDTGRIPEMKEIKTDVIFLPLGQTYTMNSIEEAANVVLDTHAHLTIPVHFGMYEGTLDDVENFCKIMQSKNIDCLILDNKGKEKK
jgi:L-ascorbate metabolism protein UlaG (beta-lactamase superfamily)